FRDAPPRASYPPPRAACTSRPPASPRRRYGRAGPSRGRNAATWPECGCSRRGSERRRRPRILRSRSLVFILVAFARMASLRSLPVPGRTVVAPGATDALSAKLIEAHGFECAYIGSYATAANRFGIPDTGLLSLEALVEQARTIAQAVKLPVIADAE